MAFTNLNSNDFAFFSSDWTLQQKRNLRGKIKDLEESIYNNLPPEIKENLHMSKIGKIFQNSKSIWFSLRPIQYEGADNINYNFDLCKNGLRYCLNTETIKAIKIFKKSISNNTDKFFSLLNDIGEYEVWLYERNLEFNSAGVYLRKQKKWKKINHFYAINLEILNNIFIELNDLNYSAVRIGIFYSKNDPKATSQDLPNSLIKITKRYFKLFKFLNNL